MVDGFDGPCTCSKSESCCPSPSCCAQAHSHSHSHVEVVEVSWFERMSQSVAAAGAGVVLIGGAVAFLWWNERRTVRRKAALQAVFKHVQELAAGEVPPADGTVVHLVGPLVVPEGNEASDDSFPSIVSYCKNNAGLPSPVCILREVQMFQVSERAQRYTERVTGGGVREVTTYSLERVWSGSYLDTSRFHSPEGKALVGRGACPNSATTLVLRLLCW
jgi:hypothetical protein